LAGNIQCAAGTFKFSGQAKNKGDLVRVNDLVGIVQDTVGSGETGLAHFGVDAVVNKDGSNITGVGVQLYYEVANGNRVTTTAASNIKAGKSLEAAGVGVGTVLMSVWPQF